jgi:hypothetical protein
MKKPIRLRLASAFIRFRRDKLARQEDAKAQMRNRAGTPVWSSAFRRSGRINYNSHAGRAPRSPATPGER